MKYDSSNVLQQLHAYSMCCQLQQRFYDTAKEAMLALKVGDISSRGPALNQEDFDEELEAASPTVPDDVKEGYFTVFAVKGKEAQRYVIELDNLTNPGFLSLLELAREEYGFQQKGVLCLPCRPQELQDILQLWKLA
ncbi:auxin-responsive protein SAUR72-like [Gossypium arboreum]|uniref:auxin-responsive protein SAUR72-like n=1 Tax=Gossypium arboreum TaxID=29729 RepID=UPI0022F1AB5A|nr:auxin-responsive protein SAUR72-like [Gossypium arboreum]